MTALPYAKESFDIGISAKAEAEIIDISNYGDFKYYLYDENTVIIIEYNGSGSNVMIPDKIGGYKVTSIGDFVFYECNEIKSITIPNGVTSIGDYTFCDCSGLISITIPNSVTSIGDSAFKYCCLTSVTIPKSVTYIGGKAFCGTSWLDAQRKKDPLVVVNNILIDAQTCNDKVTIPSNVTCIADNAFEYCTGLTSVIIPDGVASIGEEAFYSCDNDHYLLSRISES